jgi:hypothetical protein
MVVSDLGVRYHSVRADHIAPGHRHGPARVTVEARPNEAAHGADGIVMLER